MPSYRELHEQGLRANKPAMYRELKRPGELKAYLDGVVRDANNQFQLVRQQLAERNPYNPAEWKKGREAWEGWLDRTANELVLNDRVLVRDAETERAEREGGYTD